MKLGKIFLHGFFIWIILFFIGWLLRVIFLSTRNIILLILALVLILIFSYPLVTEKNIFTIGIIWLLTSVILDLIFIGIVLNYGGYYYQWNIWTFYMFLLIGPVIVKRLSK